MPSLEYRILKLLRDVTPAACVDCLANVTGLPLTQVREVATEMLTTGAVHQASKPCPICRSESLVLQGIDAFRFAPARFWAARPPSP